MYAAADYVFRIHLAFQAKSREDVEIFYRFTVEAGGRPNGVPGLKAYHDRYYAAFVVDSDGNNIEAVCDGPTARSTDSVAIEKTYTVEAGPTLRLIGSAALGWVDPIGPAQDGFRFRGQRFVNLCGDARPAAANASGVNVRVTPRDAGARQSTDDAAGSTASNGTSCRACRSRCESASSSHNRSNAGDGHEAKTGQKSAR